MGYPTDPPEDYGNNCIHCFASGKTPKFILAYASGIEIGQNWPPGWPPPPNGFHLMQQLPIACWFSTTQDVYPLCSLYWIPGTSDLGIQVSIAQFAFDCHWDSNCEVWFENVFIDEPLRRYFGGYVVLGWLVGDAFNSYLSTMKKLNIAPSVDTLADAFPLDSEKFLHRFARPADGTNILIKLDPNA
jgi:hypothetical protein